MIVGVVFCAFCVSIDAIFININVILSFIFYGIFVGLLCQQRQYQKLIFHLLGLVVFAFWIVFFQACFFRSLYFCKKQRRNEIIFFPRTSEIEFRARIAWRIKCSKCMIRGWASYIVKFELTLFAARKIKIIILFCVVAYVEIWFFLVQMLFFLFQHDFISKSLNFIIVCSARLVS